ncbi:MAG: DegT/DnrJ/EryC1/StrS family aminotransferase [Nitrospira sp.]|nr:DegT/DnrJ/EryC1/StrS family aminotransferase [Nitrospira sp.]
MKVPFIDLKIQYKANRTEIQTAIAEVCEDQAFILGVRVETLERNIADYLSVSHAIGVASGSDALLLSLMALEVGPGDEVITSPYTFFATVGAILRLGAKPVFVDIDPQTFNLNPVFLDAALTPKVKVLLPVHLFGQCSDMKSIQTLAHDEDLKIVEDAAQAIGGRYNGKKAGTLGDLGCFSFYPTKNLGGFGDGGMVVSSDSDLADQVRLLRVHGSREPYRHEILGFNSRLDALQAAVLIVKLKSLERWTELRRQHATLYERLFAQAGLAEQVILPKEQPGCYHVYNQYVIRLPRRDELKKYLAGEGVGTEVYYPVPMHLQPCLRHLGYHAGDLPEAERAAQESLALPIYSELTEDQQTYVVDKITAFYKS